MHSNLFHNINYDYKWIKKYDAKFFNKQKKFNHWTVAVVEEE